MKYSINSVLAHGAHHQATLQVAVNPLLVVAVIVQLHGVTQVTNQLLLTVAILVLLELHDTVLVLHDGVSVAVSCDVCPTVVRLILLLFRVIAVAGTDGRTCCVPTKMRLILYHIVLVY